MNVYTENGYHDRQHYLECLSQDYGIPLDFVIHLSDLLGENEDFDGLVTALQDAECS